LQDFIGLIEHEVNLSDGGIEMQTIKCTRNAAASIALVCAESSYEQSLLVLNQLAGLDLTVMTEFRVTDSVGSKFVKEVPTNIDTDEIAEIAEKSSGNIIETRIEQMESSSDKDAINEIINKALNDRPEGIFYKDYEGPTIKVMYIQCDGTGQFPAGAGNWPV
jgi:hypothetical protein